MSSHARSERRSVNDLPFPQIALVTAATFITVWKLIWGGFLILSPSRMQFEFLRFLTLLRFPRENTPDITRIAVAGFYSDGSEDGIICYKCGLTLYGLTNADDPLTLHLSLSSDCDFLKRNRDFNIRCFHCTASENDLLQNPSDGEELTLENVNNYANVTEIVFEHDPVSDNEITDSSDEQNMTYDSEHEINDMDSLPDPVRFHEGNSQRIAEEDSSNLESVNRDINVVSDLNVNLISSHGQQMNDQQDLENMINPLDRNNSIRNVLSTNGEQSCRRIIPHCNLSTQNIQQNSDNDTQRHVNMNVSRNSCGSSSNSENSIKFNLKRPDISNNFVKRFSAISSTSQEISPDGLKQNVLRFFQDYVDKEKSFFSNRLKTFLRWPKEHIVRARDLAAAGFSYTGNNDIVKCFSCNIDLSKWEEGDDAWLEHAKHGRTCSFIQQMLGPAFIKAVLENNEEEIGQYRDCLELLKSSAFNASESHSRGNYKQEDGKTKCTICHENTITNAFYPCGHAVCRTCGDAKSVCPVCESEVKDLLYLQF